jgi:limonene 1,2-monooxygenase
MKFFDENDRMRFGMFMGPYHKPGLNPTLSFEQDLKTIVNLDAWGFDEVWIGEHHSGGIESIGGPELMIAAAAQHTKRIKLGTGVVSLPYHHPFMVADRVVQLDHMTKGRIMMGVGPGQIVKDNVMIGGDPMKTRPRLQEALDAVIRLLRGETVTMKTEWFELVEAELRMLPYSNFDVAVVSVISPSGPVLAGRYGAGLISVAATDPVGIEKLAGHWEILEAEAAKAGEVADRKQWRMMGPMHLAETFEQAKEDVRHGLSIIEDYRAHINPAPPTDYFDFDMIVDAFNESGAAVIGTPEMARAQINRLIEKSGGFGTYLLMGVDWANYPATERSHQLFAEEVMPHFNGALAPMTRSFEDVMGTGYSGAEITETAQKAFTAEYEKSGGRVPEKVANGRGFIG